MYQFSVLNIAVIQHTAVLSLKLRGSSSQHLLNSSLGPATVRGGWPNRKMRQSSREIFNSPFFFWGDYIFSGVIAPFLVNLQSVCYLILSMK